MTEQQQDSPIAPHIVEAYVKSVTNPIITESATRAQFHASAIMDLATRSVDSRDAYFLELILELHVFHLFQGAALTACEVRSRTLEHKHPAINRFLARVTKELVDVQGTIVNNMWNRFVDNLVLRQSKASVSIQQKSVDEMFKNMLIPSFLESTDNFEEFLKTFSEAFEMVNSAFSSIMKMYMIDVARVCDKICRDNMIPTFTNENLEHWMDMFLSQDKITTNPVSFFNFVQNAESKEQEGPLWTARHTVLFSESEMLKGVFQSAIDIGLLDLSTLNTFVDVVCFMTVEEVEMEKIREQVEKLRAKKEEEEKANQLTEEEAEFVNAHVVDLHNEKL